MADSIHGAASSGGFDAKAYATRSKGKSHLTKAQLHEIALYRYVSDCEYMVGKAKRAFDDAQSRLDVASATLQGAQRDLATFQREQSDAAQAEAEGGKNK